MDSASRIPTNSPVQRYVRLWLLPCLGVAGLSFFLASCGHSSAAGTTPASPVVDKAVLQNIVANVALPSYQLFVTKAQALETAVAALKAAPSAASLAAAQEAWCAARVPWERSEGLQFGPQRTGDTEHLIDYFPVSELDVQNALASSRGIDVNFLQQVGLDAMGFHSIELLLYGRDGLKTALQVKPRESDYLVALSGDITAKAQALLSAWQTSSNGGRPYAEVFTLAGDEANNVYPSLTAAVADVVEGMSVISNELYVSKMAKPFRDQNTDEVQSRYSGNTVSDFVANIEGIQSIYLGAAAGQTAASGASLSAHVVAAAPDVDAALKQDFAAALAAVSDLKGPYQNAVTDAGAAAAINAAIGAVATLTSDLSNKLQPVVAGQ